MKVVFSSKYRYRAFHKPDLGIVTLVSSHLGSEVTGYGSETLWQVALDASNWNFCDCEFRLTAEGKSGMHRMEPKVVASAIEVEFDWSSATAIALSYSGRTLTLSVKAAQSLQWIQLKGSDIVFGFTNDAALAAIVVDNVVEDPLGLHESEWLDEIGI